MTDRPKIREVIGELKNNTGLSDEEISEVEKNLGVFGDTELSDEILASPPSQQSAVMPDGNAAEGGGLAKFTKEDNPDLRAQLAALKVGDKIKIALLGNKMCRTLLIMDPNKMLSQCVLKNPKLTLTEVGDFAKNSSMAQHLLRTIATSRDWMKDYTVRYNVVTNPKTPADVSLKWLRYLQTADLKKIAKSKNLPQVVAIAARKRLADAQK